MNCEYGGYRIECLEIGKGLWHARIRRADLKPVILDGFQLTALEVGFAWSTPEAAVADAQTQIEKMKKRHADAPQSELAAAL